MVVRTLPRVLAVPLACLFIGYLPCAGQETKQSKDQEALQNLQRIFSLSRRQSENELEFMQRLDEIHNMFAGKEPQTPQIRRLRKRLESKLEAIAEARRRQGETQYNIELNSIQATSATNPIMRSTSALAQLLGMFANQAHDSEIRGLLQQANTAQKELNEAEYKFAREAGPLASADEDLKQKRWESAETTFRQLINMSPDNSVYWRSLALALEQENGKSNETIQAYQSAIEADPLSSEAHSDLARYYQRLEKLDEAANEASIAFRANPNSTNSNLVYGSILLDQGEYSAAMIHYWLAIELSPDNKSAQAEAKDAGRQAEQYFRAKLNDTTAPPVLTQGWHHYLGKALFFEERFEQAEPELRTALAGPPDKTAEIAKDLGFVLIERQKYSEVIDLAKEALRAITDTEGATWIEYVLGTAYLKAGNSVEALMSFARCQKVMPGFEIFARRAREAATAAFPKLEEETRAGEPNVEKLKQLIVASDVLVKYSSAEIALKTAMRSAPQNAEITFLLGQVVIHRDSREAVKLFTKATELNKSNPLFYFALGNACRETGDKGRGVKALTEAVRLDPANVAYLNALSQALFYDHKFAEDIAICKKLIAMNPANWGATGEVGADLCSLGERENSKEKKYQYFAEAIQLLRQVPKDNPNNANAHGWLAECLFDMGWKDEAKVEAKRALALGADDQWMARFLEGK